MWPISQGVTIHSYFLCTGPQFYRGHMAVTSRSPEELHKKIQIACLISAFVCTKIASPESSMRFCLKFQIQFIFKTLVYYLASSPT